MSLTEDTLLFLAEQSQEDIHWGKPFSVSITAHGAALLLLLVFWKLAPLQDIKDVHILEVHVMGREDLALKGTGEDFDKGPLPEETPPARPLQSKGPLARGNTPRLSRSVAAKVAPAPLPKLSPLGALFGGGSGDGMASAGIGREKIYAAPSAAKQMMTAYRRPAMQGDGLVGVPSGTVDVNARRGSGAGGGNSSGQFLSGGAGSVDGGTILQRRGQPIVDRLAGVSDDPVTQRRNKIVPSSEAPPDDAFFSIRGPLSNRDILKRKLPRYPRWAEEKGVEAHISVHLTVSSDGRVLPGLRVEQTSGYLEFDQIVIDALAAFKFAPLKGPDSFKEEWGIATFNFKLKKGTKSGG